ncbi:MAG: biopolymer transporter ExbD [Polyangiales bacterium]|jgi:biopolymer transport protein ExbD
MGGVSVEGGGGGGKKAVDSNINMVPMIDLLVSCIAFLLMTAVWVQTGAVEAQQPRGQPSQPQESPPEPQEQLKIQIQQSGLRVGTNAADMRDLQGEQRFDELVNVLRQRLQANQQNREVWLQPDSVVHYDEIIRVMDRVYSVYGSPTQNQLTIRFL